ncbi:MAG: hypothetical protein WCH11_03685 [Bdellovibrio sp.]
MICQIQVNGLQLSEADEEKFALLAKDEIQEIVFQTTSESSVPGRIRELWSLELPRIISSVDDLSQKIRFQGMEGQHLNFVQLIETCQFFVQSLELLRSSVQEKDIQDQWQACEQILVKSVGLLFSSFEKKDLLGLSENLEYDLADALQRWLDLLAQHPLADTGSSIEESRACVSQKSDLPPFAG